MRVKLEDVCERGSSNLKQSDVVEMAGNYPIYGASGYIGNVDFYHQEKPYVAVVKDGAGIGRTTLHPAKSSVIGTMQYLLPKDNVLPRYLYYVVSYMHLEKYFTGATIPHIYFKDYKNEKFNLDSLDKQKEIIESLGRCEKVIESRKQELQLLDDLIKARFVEMFGNPLHPNKYLKLGEIAILERGRFSPRPRNDPKYFNGEYPFIQTGDISSSNHRLSEYKQTLNEQGIKVSKKFCVGTIVMAIVGATIGATAILEREVYAPDSVIGITPYNYNNIFLETLLQFWQPQLLANAPESARPNINLAILGEVPIIDVDVVLQNQFADFVNQINKSKVVYQIIINKLTFLQKICYNNYKEQYYIPG